MINNDGLLPIQKGVDVISVGVSFLRFLELATKLQKPTAVVTDNDGDIEALNRKYVDYFGDNAKDFVKIYFDQTVDPGVDLTFNYNTLEPKMLKANSLTLFNTIFSKDYASEEDLRKYMKAHKTDCALAIFETIEAIAFPEYILEAIKDE
jgi:putative ATP-dependent endonuclease of OLD family